MTANWERVQVKRNKPRPVFQSVVFGQRGTSKKEAGLIYMAAPGAPKALARKGVKAYLMSGAGC